jgi:hypothetical protein
MKVYHSLELTYYSGEYSMDIKVQKNGNDIDERMTLLNEIAIEIVNSLAIRKVNGNSLNVADIYFILSRTLQHVSFLNLLEIDEYKRKNQTEKMLI